nr:DUF6261 family protein [uncultured Carboxylicivirga sp.]
MEKIHSNTRTTDTDNVCSGIIDLYQKNPRLSEHPHMVTIIKNLINVSINLNEAIKRSKSKSILEEKDNDRDTKYRNFYHLISGNTHHPDPAISKPALQIQVILDKYGLEITSESYTSESSMFNSFINDMRSDEMQQALQAISGGVASFEAFEQSQNNFNTTFIEHKEDKANEGTYENASTIKREAIKIINHQLIGYLHTLQQIDEENFGEFARQVNQLITDNNKTVKQRLKLDTDKETGLS